MTKKISFESVERVWIAEKTSTEIVELDEEFYPGVARYVAELNYEINLSEHLRKELLQEELQNILSMVQEIHLLRVLKAIREVANGRLSSSLLERERYSFTEIKQTLEKLYGELIAPMLKREAISVPPPEPINEMLIVLATVPKIVGDDLRSYGPFEKGEIATLPKKSAEVLVKHGFARKIETRR